MRGWEAIFLEKHDVEMLHKVGKSLNGGELRQLYNYYKTMRDTYVIIRFSFPGPKSCWKFRIKSVNSFKFEIYWLAITSAGIEKTKIVVFVFWCSLKYSELFEAIIIILWYRFLKIIINMQNQPNTIIIKIINLRIKYKILNFLYFLSFMYWCIILRYFQRSNRGGIKDYIYY